MFDGCGAARQVRLHQIDPGEVFVGGIDALEALARNPHEAGQARAASDEEGLIAHLKELVHRQGFADDGIALDLNAQRAQAVNFLLHDLLGQTKFGDAIAQHAAWQVQRLKNGHGITQLGQIARAGQPAGTRADHGDLVPIGRGLCRRGAFLSAVPVRHEALQTADTHRLALDAAHAFPFALAFLRADAAAYRR